MNEIVSRIGHTKPAFLNNIPLKDKFYNKNLLNSEDVQLLQRYHNNILDIMFYKLLAAETIDDVYRYFSVVMHFDYYPQFYNIWTRHFTREIREKLFFGLAGPIPPLLFQAVLHGKMQFVDCFMSAWENRSDPKYTADIFKFSLRAVGFSGNTEVALAYIQRLKFWNVFDQVFAPQNRHLFKTFRDAAQLGHENIILLLLRALPNSVTTRKGTFPFAAKLLSCEPDFLLDLATRATSQNLWRGMDALIPVDEPELARFFYQLVLLHALRSYQFNNAEIIFNLARERDVLDLIKNDAERNSEILPWLTAKMRPQPHVSRMSA